MSSCREYKEALKQQRAHDVPSIYRTTKDNDDQSYKTEPNTPTHQPQTLATSKSDPTPLNSAFSSPKHVFDDTNSKKPIQKVQPSTRNLTTANGSVYSSPTHNNSTLNGNTIELNKNARMLQDYVKPKSPLKSSTGIMSHDNVPICNANNGMNGRSASPSTTVNYTNGSSNNSPKTVNGVKSNRNISWNQDVPMEKMSFTMRREIDKAREETDLINQLRTVC